MAKLWYWSHWLERRRDSPEHLHLFMIHLIFYISNSAPYILTNNHYLRASTMVLDEDDGELKIAFEPDAKNTDTIFTIFNKVFEILGETEEFTEIGPLLQKVYEFVFQNTMHIVANKPFKMNKHEFVITIDKEKKLTADVVEKKTGGSYGTVYLTNRNAYKRFEEENLCDMISEIHMLTKFKNSGGGFVVQMFSVDWVNLTIEMELATDNLKNFIAKGKANGMESDICSQLMDGLEFIHSYGVVHLDIKPANVLVFADQKVKYADFNMSKYTAFVNNTMVAFTMDYAPFERFFKPFSPEYARFGDVWSMLCTMYCVHRKKNAIELTDDKTPNELYDDKMLKIPGYSNRKYTILSVLNAFCFRFSKDILKQVAYEKEVEWNREDNGNAKKWTMHGILESNLLKRDSFEILRKKMTNVVV